MESSLPQQEKRRLTRHALTGPVSVYDRSSQEFLGQVVNIHREGMMMMGNFPYKEGVIYQIDLHLPESIEGTQLIPMAIDCLWTRDEDDSRAYWAGSGITEIGSDALRQLDALIAVMAVE